MKKDWRKLSDAQKERDWRLVRDFVLTITGQNKLKNALRRSERPKRRKS